MTITFADKEEREIISRLIDDLAQKQAPLYRNARIILKAATTPYAPAKPGWGRCKSCKTLHHLKVNGAVENHEYFSGQLCSGSGNAPMMEAA